MEQERGGVEKSLRILHLEDEPNDVELIRAALDSLGCEVEAVSTRADFTASVERGGIDLILSDFSLPEFDGRSALKIARERLPNVPFIFVSGTLGEEAAIDSVRSGATDYVLKHRLSRLAPAARRALDEFEERKRRKWAEDRLHNERLFLKALLESLEVGIVACDAEGTLTFFNRAMRESYGLSEASIPGGPRVEDCSLMYPDGKTPMEKDAIPLFRALRGERVRSVEMTIVPANSPARTLLGTAQPITDEHGERLGAVAAMHDITERKQLEAQFRQAQKMEAVGQLASGVAHDFNNLLSVVMGYCELAMAQRAVDGPLRDKLEQILRAAERAAELTRQLLAFSRKQVIEPRILDLNALLAETNKMLRRLIRADVDLATRTAPDLGRVRADPGQVEQILVNLVVNARDAMPSGGQLVLETANVDLDDAFAARHAGALAGAYVMLAVHDTGVGMDAAVQSRIFEPFFTTKDAGKGTGLGLATVYGIVKQSGGYVSVDSEPGRGTTFRIYLPLVEESPESINRDAHALAPRGTETVLVVEDEEAVRELLRSSLSEFGYNVLEAEDFARAVETCRAQSEPIHLLLTDLVLPGVSGREVAKTLTLLQPGLKVLYTSGYTEDAAVRQGGLARGEAFIQKPYGLTTLALKVRDVLDGRAK